MLTEASHAIVVCVDENLESGPGYYKLDCSAATQNMLLAAHSMDLGAVWLGVEPRPERIRAVTVLLGLPPHVHPLSIVSLGVPVKGKNEIPERFEPGKIRWNRWE
jgi:nitroreductase